MSDSDKQRALSDRESKLIDSLLQHSLSDQAEQEERRITRLLTTVRGLDVEPTRGVSRTNRNTSEPARWKRWGRWVSIPAVAALVAALIFVLQTSSSESQAYAAVQRSLRAEQVATAREYVITFVSRLNSGRLRTNEITLFVERDRFAIRAKPRIGPGDIWMGGQGEKRWIVPRVGPVVVGKQGLLPRWSRQRKVAEAPFLKVSTILDRMQRAYDLQLQPEASMPNSASGQADIECEHIRGVRRSAAPDSIPQTVELWADARSAFARRIELKWDRRENEQGCLQATAQLVSTPNLPADFFDHSAHHSKNRVVVENDTE